MGAVVWRPRPGGGTLLGDIKGRDNAGAGSRDLNLSTNLFEPGDRQRRMTQQPSPGPDAGRNQEIGGEDGPLKVEIYTWRFCPYCIRAKGLLDRKGVIYNEYMIDGDETARKAMTRRAEGRSTLPQIFINNRSIGGCDDLMELDRTGWLNKFLGIKA